MLLRSLNLVAARRTGVVDGVGADGAQVGRDLVGEHLFQAEAEEVRGVAAVGASDNVAAGAGGAARASVAGGTTVGQPGAEGEVLVDVTKAVVEERPLPLRPHELALENLPPTPDGAERVTVNDEE